jgi:hypothetical protein
LPTGQAGWPNSKDSPTNAVEDGVAALILIDVWLFAVGVISAIEIKLDCNTNDWQN